MVQKTFVDSYAHLEMDVTWCLLRYLFVRNSTNFSFYLHLIIIDIEIFTNIH
jgi:hypothetical protein